MATFDDYFVKAQDLACEVAPEYAKYIRWWIPYARPGSQRMHVTESRNFYFDPDSMSTEELAAELIHLSHHVVQRHNQRGEVLHIQKRRNDEKFWPSLWRIATCLETTEAWNERLSTTTLRWAEGTDLSPYIKPPRRMKAEDIYDWLDKELTEEQKQEIENSSQGKGQQQQGQGQGQGKPGQGQQQGGQPGSGAGQDQQPGNVQGAEAGEHGGEGGSGMCRLEEYDLNEDEVEQGTAGQGQQGQEGQQGQGQGQGQQGKEGEGQEGQGRPNPNGNQKQAGSEDAEIQRESDPSKRRHMMWRRLLKELTAQNELPDDYAMPPSNRSPEGTLLPDLRQSPDSIGILLDVSGSVGDTELSIYIEIANTISKQIPDVRVATGDTKVTRVGRPKILKEKILGGGGTTFDRVIPDAYKKLHMPRHFLVITDGFTDFPKKLPPNTTILIIDEGGSAIRNPRIAENVRKKMIWIRLSDLKAPDLTRELPGRVVRRTPTPQSQGVTL